MTTRNKRIFLKPFDAAWFFVETSTTPANVGPLLILTPPEGAPSTFIGDLVEQWRQNKSFAAPFNYRIHRNPVPTWEVLADDQIDLDYHLRHLALPAPGGERELGVMISRLHSHQLDLKRPLWECHVIEGLEGGRFAIYLKFHHGQLDGVGTARLIERMMTQDANARDLLPPWSVGLAGNRRAAEALTTTSTAEAAGPSRISEIRAALGGAGEATKALANMITRIRSGNEPELTAPFQAPRTIFNGRISAQRRFATQHYDLSRFRTAAKAAGVTVNDVFLSITGGAMRRYLAEFGDLPDRSVTGQVPVNVRTSDGTSVGNQLGFIYARLHTDIADPLERLRAINESTSAGKSVHESLHGNAVAPFTIMLTGPYIAQAVLGLGGYVPPSANLVISNVPGPRETLYFNGARVENIYGPSVLFHGQALNITMSSYTDRANISFTGCRDSMPSMQKLAVYTGEALDELEAALEIAVTADASV